MTSSAMELSVVIPAYNEAKRISSTLQQVVRYFRTQGLLFEVVVVDDGSSDNTLDLVSEVARTNSAIRIVTNGRNRGKGFSVRHGVQEAKGEIVLFSDADLSSPIEESGKLLQPIWRNEFDMAIGSRAVDRKLIGTHQPWWREQSGRVFNLLVQAILGLRFSDTQCGFKAFRRLAVVPILEQQRILGFGFDPELLYLAKLQKLRVAEVPVRWNHAPGSKVKFLSDSLNMLLDLARIRWNHFRRKYNEETAHDTTGC
jgi:dolichyl-phosphate beta-glucosyltransferase